MDRLRSTAVIVPHFGNPELTRRAVERIRELYPNPLAPRVYLVENSPLPLSFPVGVSVTRVSVPENRGYAGGSNAGIHASLQDRAELLVLINNDAELSPGSLEDVFEAARDPRVGLIGVVTQEGDRHVYGGGRVSWWALRASLARTPLPPERLHFIHGACMGITTRCLSSIGVFREEYFVYWEDVEYSLRARRAGWRLAVTRTIPVRHRGSASTDSFQAEKTYYLVRNAHFLVRDAGPWWAGLWARALRAPRRYIALRRGKHAVVRGVDDARRGRVGPAPTDI